MIGHGPDLVVAQTAGELVGVYSGWDVDNGRPGRFLAERNYPLGFQIQYAVLLDGIEKVLPERPKCGSL